MTHTRHNHTKDVKDERPTLDGTPFKLQATPHSPVKKGTRAFTFPKQTNGHSHFLTPNGSTVKVDPFKTGYNHLYSTTLSSPETLITSHSPTRDGDDYRRSKIKLFSSLRNLTVRTDGDYNHFKTHDEIDEGHYNASKIKIDKCISSLRRFFDASPNKIAFIEKLNKKMEERSFSNPFRLKDIYEPTAFNKEKYLELNSLIDYQKPITISDFKPSNSLKRKRPVTNSSVTIFKPRSLKRRKVTGKENASPQPRKLK